MRQPGLRFNAKFKMLALAVIKEYNGGGKAEAAVNHWVVVGKRTR